MTKRVDKTLYMHGKCRAKASLREEERFHSSVSCLTSPFLQFCRMHFGHYVGYASSLPNPRITLSAKTHTSLPSLLGTDYSGPSTLFPHYRLKVSIVFTQNCGMSPAERRFKNSAYSACGETQRRCNCDQPSNTAWQGERRHLP